jgi:hypothetical protein
MWAGEEGARGGSRAKREEVGSRGGQAGSPERAQHACVGPSFSGRGVGRGYWRMELALGWKYAMMLTASTRCTGAPRLLPDTRGQGRLVTRTAA